MKVLSFLFATLFIIPALRAGDMKVKFAKKTWDEAQAQAKAEGKLFYVDFDASYSAVCRSMDQSTYMDENLAWFISQNVVALRLDVQDFEGIRWAQQYELEALPMMILFNSEGKEVRRFTGYHTGRQLLDILTKYATPNNMKVVASKSSTASKPTASKPAAPAVKPPAPAPTVKTPAAPVDKPNPPAKPASLPIVKPSTAPTVAKKGKGEYFELVTPGFPPTGYFVQIGAYEEPSNLLPEASKYRKSYPKHKIYTYTTEINGKTYYRLLIGLFETRTEADKLNKTLKSNGYKSIVKTTAEI